MSPQGNTPFWQFHCSPAISVSVKRKQILFPLACCWLVFTFFSVEVRFFWHYLSWVWRLNISLFNWMFLPFTNTEIMKRLHNWNKLNVTNFTWNKEYKVKIPYWKSYRLGILRMCNLNLAKNCYHNCKGFVRLNKRDNCVSTAIRAQIVLSMFIKTSDTSP